jgi:hypothetical protein
MEHTTEQIMEKTTAPSTEQPTRPSPSNSFQGQSASLPSAVEQTKEEDETRPIISHRSTSPDSQPSRAPSTVELFDLAHSRKHHHSEEEHGQHIQKLDGGLAWSHLSKRPLVRQFLVGEVSARETAKRDVSCLLSPSRRSLPPTADYLIPQAARFELFLDLVRPLELFL